MNNDLHNSFPVDSTKKTKIIKPDIKNNNLSVLNVGQILVLILLIIILSIQTLNILYFNLNNSPGQNIENQEFSGENYISENSRDNSPDINSEIIQDKSDNILFILGESNGRLAVLGPDGKTVYETFDVYINTLPEYDRNLLKDGIKIKSAQELASLLEDYSS